MKNRFFFIQIAAFAAIITISAGCVSGEEKKSAPFALAGTLWMPVNGPQGAVLEFSPDSRRIVGTTNGNRFFAPIEKADGDLLNFGNIAITRAIAKEPEKEMLFIDALERTRAWKLNGNTLTLENEHKKTVLKLKRLFLKKRVSK